MSDKEKKTEKDEPEKAATTIEEKAKPAEVKAADPKPVQPEAVQVPSASYAFPSRGGLFGKRGGAVQESKADLDSLAQVTGTSLVVLNALKAAYNWSNKTRLTRAEFLEKRDAWLARSAKEV